MALIPHRADDHPQTDANALSLASAFLELAEGSGGGRPYSIHDGTITIGYGYTFLRGTSSTKTIYNHAIGDFQEIGAPLSATQLTLIGTVESKSQQYGLKK